MDTIHHLLRLNVEIEGALRVLTDRDNEIAMRILDEKVKELYDIVQYLAHPEEEPDILSENCEKIDSKKTSNDTSADRVGLWTGTSVSSCAASAEEFDGSSQIELTRGEESKNDYTSFDDSLTESEAVGRVLGIDANLQSLTHKVAAPANIGAVDKEKDEMTPAPPENTHFPNTDLDKEKNHQPDSRPISGTVPAESFEVKSKAAPVSREPQKEKIRIDEMLSRREARDLSKAFTINDRFRFQLHLFDGNKEAFNATITAISAMTEYEHALAHLNGILDLDTDDQDVADFLAIIQNHFGL